MRPRTQRLTSPPRAQQCLPALKAGAGAVTLHPLVPYITSAVWLSVGLFPPQLSGVPFRHTFIHSTEFDPGLVVCWALGIQRC